MRRAARVLALTAAFTVLLPAVPALGSTEKILFTYGTDRSSWYWNKQVDEEVGAGPISQRVRVRNPQNPDTLPIAVEGGKHERISALYFDISGRGVTSGSTITRAVLEIDELSDPNEQPPYNARGKVIQACRIEDFWPGGEAEKWETAPAYDDSACVKGKRNGKSDPPTWTFNLTRIAGPWGEDPFGSNSGVMLLGVIPKDAGPTDSWQINLKVPSRDKEVTPGDDYKQTRDRAVLSLTFSPGQAAVLAPPPPPPPPPPPDFGSGAGFAPSSDFGSQGSEPQSPVTQSPAPPSAESIPAEPVSEARPRAPWYVWMLIPLGLLAWAAVRPLILEPARGIRPDGAVMAIRRLNAQRRGSPLEEPVDPLVRTLHALQGAGRGIARVSGAVRVGTGRVAGSVGAFASGILRTVRRR
ncbi:MAG TPA: hypothetical protein VGR49_07440 [Actinomycetota bacterium]|jgi:hypothetical protein|nr:hypothetical protein [Actinomycetota bacterium]